MNSVAGLNFFVLDQSLAMVVLAALTWQRFAHRPSYDWLLGSTYIYASQQQRRANLEEVRRINLPTKGDFL